MSRRAVAVFVVVFASVAAVAYVAVPPPRGGDPRVAQRDAAHGADNSSTDDDAFLAAGEWTGADELAFDAEPEIQRNEWVPRGLAQVQRRQRDDPDRSLVVRVRGRAAASEAVSVLPGVPVRVEPEGAEPFVGSTDERGEFRVGELSTLATVRIAAQNMFPVVVRDVGPGVLETSLVRSIHLVGQVVDAEASRAISGARVRGMLPHTPARATDTLFDVRTAVNGWFTVEVPAVGPLRLLVDVPDGRRVEMPFVDPSSGTTRVFVPSGGRIEGRVRRVAGEPVTGARIYVVRQSDAVIRGAAPGFVRGIEVSETNSILDGSYLIAGIEPQAEYSVRAEGQWGERSVEVSVALAKTGVARVDLVLLPPVSVEIELVDEDGSVVRDARITVAGHPYATVVEPSGVRGPYRIKGVTPGMLRIRVDTPLGPGRDFTIDAVPGANRLPVTVDAGVRIDGFVVDMKGLGVEGALVTIEREGANGGAGESRTTRTRAGGEFAFGQLTVGSWRVSASTPGAFAVETVVDAPKRGVRLTLAAVGRARIQLLRESGGPVEGDYETRRAREDGEVIRGSGTLQNGIATIEGFDGRPESLEIFVDGYSPAIKEVVVAPEADADLGAVILRKGHQVEGIVVGADGVGIQGAFVLVGHLGRVVSDRNGKWSFPGVPSGPLSILVVSEFHLKKSVDFESTTEFLRIELTTGAHVEGVVVGSDGKGYGGLPVSFVPIDGDHVGEVVERLRTDEDGSFDARVPPGRYRIEAKDDDATAPVLLADVTLTDGVKQRSTLVYRTK